MERRKMMMERRNSLLMAMFKARIPRVSDQDNDLDWNISNFMEIKNGKEIVCHTLRTFAIMVRSQGSPRKVFMSKAIEHGYNKGTAARQWQVAKSLTK